MNSSDCSRVLLVCDRPNWAYDAIAKALIRYNNDPSISFDVAYIKGGDLPLEELVKDETAGIALRNAKNKYLPEDISSGAIRAESYIMFQHYVLHGDPAFNPYEPANA